LLFPHPLLSHAIDRGDIFHLSCLLKSPLDPKFSTGDRNI
jgi:hypothetical protein